MSENELIQRAETVRRFNRFYTRKIGILEDGLLHSSFSLTEGRVIYEIAQRDGINATELRGELSLDAGYLSRVLTRLEKQDIICRKISETDARQNLLSLTEKGREVFTRLNTDSREEIRKMLSSVSEGDQQRLIDAMGMIEDLLGSQPQRPASYLLRPHQSGDMGWVVYRHGVLYKREYGWNEEFEGLVAGVVSQFIREFDSKQERCWIAEKDGRNVGSVFLVRHPQRESFARLRLLLVEPEARGMGIGRRLVHECTRFAREAGYKGITLWTNSLLHAARTLYEAEGYRLVSEESHHRFGHDLIDQTWELAL